MGLFDIGQLFIGRRIPGTLVLCSVISGFAIGSIVGKGGLAGKDARPTWQTLADGLRVVRESKRPAIVWYTGKDPGDHFFRRQLKNPRFLRQVKRFVLIRIDAQDLQQKYPQNNSDDKPDGPVAERKGPVAERKGPIVQPKKANGNAAAPAPPPLTVAEQLRLLDDPESFLVLSFREHLLRRYEPMQDPPRRSALFKELGTIFKKDAAYAKMARLVERVLRSSVLDFQSGKKSEAVRQVLHLDKPAGRDGLDPVLRRRVEKQISEYRSNAEKLLEQAQKLIENAKLQPKNSAKNFGDALKIYDQLARDYPFKDVLERVNTRKGLLITWMRLNTAPPVAR